MPRIESFATLDLLHEAAADAFCELVMQALASKEFVNISLSGGSTPKRLYELLADRELPWHRIHWFWGDERNVPHDDNDSNARMVREALLERVSVPESNIHCVPVDILDAASAAIRYEQTLRDHFAGEPFPTWDLALLGMGDDAHTASLFPGTRALDERQRWFVENWVEKFDAYRYTMTVPAINSAKESWFLIAGEGKRDAVARVLQKEGDPKLYPSRFIDATRWFITRDAYPDASIAP